MGDFKKITIVLSVAITADTDRDPWEWGDAVASEISYDLEESFGDNADIMVQMESFEEEA